MSDADAALKTASEPAIPAAQARQSNATMATRNVLSGILFLVVAFLLLFLLIPYGVDAPRKVKFAALHPAYYPQLVTYCLMILGVLVLLGGIRQLLFSSRSSQTGGGVSTESAQVSDDENTPVTGDRFIRLLPLVVLFAALFFALPYLGFPLSTAFALLVLMPLAGERRWYVILPVAILLPMLLYLFFTQVANIPIPGGVLDPWLLKI